MYMIGLQEYRSSSSRNTQSSSRSTCQEYKSIGVYAVVQYAMYTVTTRSTRVLVVGVYKSTAIYVAESIAVVCQVSTVVQQYHGTTYRSTTIIICMYYILTMYNSVLHRISSSIYTVAQPYNCIAVSVRGFNYMQVLSIL